MPLIGKASAGEHRVKVYFDEIRRRDYRSPDLRGKVEKCAGPPESELSCGTDCRHPGAFPFVEVPVDNDRIGRGDLPAIVFFAALFSVPVNRPLVGKWFGGNDSAGGMKQPVAELQMNLILIRQVREVPFHGVGWTVQPGEGINFIERMVDENDN